MNPSSNWPARSRHFLRLGKQRFAPLILFVNNPKYFKRSIFDQLLSILYDRLPQELVHDVKYGHLIVSSPYTSETPFYSSEFDVEFCYYWTPTPKRYSILLPSKTEVSNSVKASGSRNMELLESTALSLVLCVLSYPSQITSQLEMDSKAKEVEGEDDELMLGLNVPIQQAPKISKYFPRASPPPPAPKKTGAPTSEERDFLSSSINTEKKRKRES